MMSDVIFDEYPDISFIDDMSLQDVMKQMISWYQDRYEEITGESIVLHDADPEKLRLDTISYMYYQILVYLDFMAKQNLLKYSTGAFLDNIAARCGIQRKEATVAFVTIRFTLSTAQATTYIIPKGTRCTSGDDIFFFVVEDGEIPAGEMSVDLRCECTATGEEGNHYGVGEINTLVDTLPYIQSVSNTTISEGGAERETDDDFAVRIFLKPSTFSTAGVDDAYIFWTKSANNNIGDVVATSPSPCNVKIVFSLKNGEIPDDAMIDEVLKYLNEKSKKVLGDRLIVQAPDLKECPIDVTYYIGETDRKKSSQISNDVSDAIEQYKQWQCEKIGRDINPSKLEYLMMLAGAKRVEIRSPVFTKVLETEIPRISNETVVYGGIEDD